MLTIQTSPNFQPEKEYAFHVLLHEMLGIEYLVNYQDVKGYELRLPNGAALNIKDDFPLLQLPESLKLSGSSVLLQHALAFHPLLSS